MLTVNVSRVCIPQIRIVFNREMSINGKENVFGPWKNEEGSSSKWSANSSLLVFGKSEHFDIFQFNGKVRNLKHLFILFEDTKELIELKIREISPAITFILFIYFSFFNIT